jgi:hypothetical protein
VSGCTRHCSRTGVTARWPSAGTAHPRLPPRSAPEEGTRRRSVDMRHRSTPVRPHNGTRSASRGSNRSRVHRPSAVAGADLCHTPAVRIDHLDTPSAWPVGTTPKRPTRSLPKPTTTGHPTPTMACGQPLDPQVDGLLASPAPEFPRGRHYTQFLAMPSGRPTVPASTTRSWVSDLVEKWAGERGSTVLGCLCRPENGQHAQPVDKRVDHCGDSTPRVFTADASTHRTRAGVRTTWIGVGRPAWMRQLDARETRADRT